VGWAQFSHAQAEAVIAGPGATLLAQRTVYFERWCLDMLAATIAQDTLLLPWMRPQRMPHVHIEGTTVHLPFTAPYQMSAAAAAVLVACDGRRRACDLAADLVGAPGSPLGSIAEVYALLEELVKNRRIAWTLQIPNEGWHHEHYIREALEEVDDERLRRQSLAVLDHLETARAEVRGAVGDPEQLEQALDTFEATFSKLTGAGATRAGGKTYAGRTLLYEDTRRNIDVTFGPDLLKRLGPTLELLLTSARWLTYDMAERYRQNFTTAYTELVQRTGSRRVPLHEFLVWVHSSLFHDDDEHPEDVDYDAPPRPIDLSVAEFQSRWAKILQVPLEQRRVGYRSADLRAAILATFDAPRPGWRAARYHSPDIMIVADSVAAIERGEYQIVLGEMHAGMNTLDSVALAVQHPQLEDLRTATARDLPEPRVIHIFSKAMVPIGRALSTMSLPKDYRLVRSPDAFARQAETQLLGSDLILEVVDGTLEVATRDGQLRFDIIEVFADFLAQLVVGTFQIMPSTDHIPRVSIDNVVICRESWIFTPSEIPFASIKDLPERFVSARQWQKAQGIPRFVFVRASTEQKPFYVDFDSPIYIDLLAKVVRQAADSPQDTPTVQIAEMLPTPDQIWLPDAEGQRYTSELRIVAVDPVS
jgi:hypothetical protein